MGGLTPLTTVDWEGHLAAVVFGQGCPWRCRYCHNTSLIPWDDVMAFLQERRGFLDGVVFSGGEPTAQTTLPEAVAAVADIGYQVAVHTNGGHPGTLARLFERGLPHHVAMDVKGPFARYEEITRARGSGRKAQQSVTAIIKSGVPYEFRTTYHSDLLSDDEVLTIAEDLRWRGAETYFIQKYRWEGTGDMPLALTPSAELSPDLLARLGGMFQTFGVRG